MAQRVTLSDFRELQEQLIETRRLLFESREREANAADALQRQLQQQASAFPPPPPRRASSATATTQNSATPASPASPSASAHYPTTLNPFGDDESGGPSAPTLPAASMLPKPDALISEALLATAERPPPTAALAVARERRAAALRARAIRRATLAKLAFHGWCASHRQTKILRNMGSMANAMLQTAS